MVNFSAPSDSDVLPCSRHADWSELKWPVSTMAPPRAVSRQTQGEGERAVTYKRFAAAGEAIRYAVEVLPVSSFLGAFLEVKEERFDSNAIRRLYESVEYPLAAARCDSGSACFR